MRKRTAILISLSIFIGLAIGLSTVWYMIAQAAEVDTSVASDGGAVALNASGDSSMNIPISQADPASTQTNTPSNSQNTTNNSLKVNDNTRNSSNNTTTQSSTGVSANAPSLDELQQYDTTYKDKDSAFFGDLRTGDGAQATSGKTITVDYRGWLTDGKIFDESYAAGKHFQFVLGENRVIAGWEQGLLGMKVGGKRRIIVPPAVGYGVNAQGPIPANSLMVFDVELLAVQ